MKNQKIITASLALLFIAVSVSAQSSGSNFTITQSAIASGGGNAQSADGAFSLDGTIGQPLAGGALNGSPFSITSGFWNFSPSAPTAATVTIGGRALTSTGRGIRNVIIRLTDATGAIRFATTTTFGYYRFTDINAGETYIITAKGKRFEFSQPSRVLNVNEDESDVNFIANPN